MTDTENSMSAFENFKGTDLYKKYRPNRWENIIGQDKVVESLKKAVRDRNLAGGYGFFGPAGCGKTSAALLFAKALNCENLSDKQNPCNKCPSCISIEADTNFGVHYISMANQGSVDSVREIVERSKIKQQVKQQVWILDETHNLHEKAFDALLIPVEKKQSNSIFIFCSTEPQKIKDTVLQRIQSRTFVKVAPGPMGKHLQSILKAEGVKDYRGAEAKEAIQEAIRRGQGHVRKTISALEEIISTGYEEKNSIGDSYLEAVASLDPVKMLTVVSEAVDAQGLDVNILAKNLHSQLRSILLLSAGVDADRAGVNPVKGDPLEWVKQHFTDLDIFSKFLAIHGEAYEKASFALDVRMVYESYLAKGMLSVRQLQKKKG